MPSQPEDEFVLVLSTAGDWNVNIEPNKPLVSKTLAVLRSCLIKSLVYLRPCKDLQGCLWAGVSGFSGLLRCVIHPN